MSVYSFVLALLVQAGRNGVEAYRQNELTKDLCNLVSLPLETSLVRDTYEGLQSALKARGEVGSCVSVTDNGRSYSPECTQGDTSYRTVFCKARGNKGIQAAISFPTTNLLGGALIFWWVAICGLIFILRSASAIAVRQIIEIYSSEVNSLLDGAASQGAKASWLTRLARFSMAKVGISSELSRKAQELHSKMLGYEKKIGVESAARSRLENEVMSTKEYKEKVRQIRHDIRSPLTSLQVLYEHLQTEGGQPFLVVNAAIRRIQLLIDDLNQVDKIREEPKLVIAEVAVEEIALLIAEKFETAKSAKITVNYSTDSLTPIHVGAKGFQSSIENLLENALEAISLGGGVKIYIQSAGGVCKILVEDDGCGISEENAGRLFTRGGTFGKINGLGLGLYHTKLSVESWGGTVTHEKRERGACFAISLPVMQTGVVFTSLPNEPRIKVIDDDALVPQVLDRAGYEVVDTAQTFNDGKRLLADGTGDGFAILVDQFIGEEHLGTDLISSQAGRKKIFLCTNDYDDLSVVRLAREIGVKIIPKPLCFIGVHRTLESSLA